MPYESLGDFLSILEDTGELVRIRTSVDSALEIAEITRRVGQTPRGGPALFFESVRGGLLPVVTNLLGSESRLCRALGVRTLEELSTRLIDAAAPGDPSSWLDALKLTPMKNKAAAFAPKVVKQGYCQQIVKLGRDVNLWELPVPRSWPEEPHPVITSGLVFTRCPVTHQRMIERIPVRVTDQRELVPCWHRQHATARIWKSYVTANQQMPIAIAFGGPVAGALLGTSILPDGMDRAAYGGLLQGNALELVKCRTNDLEVPAHAEIVIEAMIDPSAALQPPTPVALPSGFYADRSESLPTINVTAITHRANPIFPAIIVHGPPSEDAWLRRASERLLLPWIKATIPELCDWHFPECDGGRNWLFASLRKTEPMQGHRVLHALWGHPCTSLIKSIVVVDDSVNVHSMDDVWSAVGVGIDPSRDVLISSGPKDGDDLVSSSPGSGHKLGIDATRKLPDEGRSRTPLRDLVMPPSVLQQITERWPEWGLPAIKETT